VQVLDASILPEGRGSIVFDGKTMSKYRRNFWVIENAGTVKFTLEENDLKPHSRITVSGFRIPKTYKYAGFLNEVYIE